MDFQKEKKEFLGKKDKSRKGSIDIKIRKLASKINSFDNFYTTSSCSGRILLSAIPESNKKNEVKYLFSSHRKIRFAEIKKIICSGLPKDDVWFKVQPVILHVACKNTGDAKKLLNTARDIGFRRSGIISMGKSKVVLELISTEKIEAIVSRKGKLLIDEDYFKILVKEGNKKLEKTWKKISMLYGKLNKIPLFYTYS
jgi:tRNA wybutosine-synthesizing protein 3